MQHENQQIEPPVLFELNDEAVFETTLATMQHSIVPMQF